MTITFEYDDLLKQITDRLSLDGVKPLLDADGKPQISFNQKKKEVTVHCEAAPSPEACPFCKHGVDQELQTKQDSKTTKTNDEDETTTANEDNEDSQANTGEQESMGEPMSLAQLKSHSRALATKPGPIKHNVQRGAEAHASLVEPGTLEGESSESPFGGGGD